MSRRQIINFEHGTVRMAIIPSNSTSWIQDNIPFEGGTLYASIPRELKESALWCGFRKEPNPDPAKKDRKPPYSAVTGGLAKVNDPTTLTTYAKVAAAFAAMHYDGFNRAFGFDDFVGIDLDNIRDPATGEITCEKAAEIIHRFLDAGAYIEISPSDTGIRIICRGTFLRFGKGVKGFHHFEVYGRGPGGLHFLSVTGNAIRAVDEIPICQEALDWLYETYFKKPEVIYERPEYGLMDSPPLSDDEIIEKLRRSKHGVEFIGFYDNGGTGDHSSDDLRMCSMIGFYTQDSEQIDQIFRGSALYRDKWDRADYRTSTINKALEGLTATWQPPQHAEGQHYGLTESEAARRFTDSDLAEGFKVLRFTRQAQVQRYNEGLGIWQRDNHGFELKKSARETVKVILTEIIDEPDPVRRTKLLSLAAKIETNRGLNDVSNLVMMDLPEFLPDLSNTKDYILCVANGLVYMPLGKLWPHCEDFQFTLQSPVTYDTEAECPLWVKFIDEFCCGDVALIQFIQSWSGYCCSGYVNEQKMAVFYGRGQNGKSVYLEVMKHTLGGFAATTPADTLLQRKSEQSNDLAALEYVRFVSAIESDEGQALAEGRIKALTGGDEIVCRKLFEEYRTFTPRFKLNLATNSKPRVNGTDFGIWRRLLLIPCKAEIHNPDKHLLEKLKTEAPGILNWLVQGFQRWQAEGLVIPACIVTATQEYRAECDTVGRFLDGVCNPYEDSINHHDGIQASLLYKAYSAWCLAEGHKPFSNVRFSQKMTEHGFPSYKKPGGMFYTHALRIGAR